MKKIILASCIFILSACSSYKLEVQQGNLVTQTSISKLQQGMSKQEVQSLLGTPLLQDNFNNNRWDYVFYQNKREGKNHKKQQNVSLTFKNGQLVSVSN